MAEEIFYATGKRKTAVARVWLKPGGGDISINRKPMNQYVNRESDRVLIMEPLVANGQTGKFDISVNVNGGGIHGQAAAIRHGISKALTNADPALRDPIKKAGFLTRDSRKKERKKYGQPGARARFQYSKR
ncbi:30S ribosomal subunit protein S9 [uncultured Desulfobacterium sp.]|uniref:Small ribosomal subunit protein uS9 n=1 Tax=uncultured Desulfobacterium sp. TaxID=201089 RepID=A0A445MXS5_9BACT|nr:30S ribosomal subunit protein S9 [uncultured Desulfobacterium sp.]